jgi:hypothetical protein
MGEETQSAASADSQVFTSAFSEAIGKGTESTDGKGESQPKEEAGQPEDKPGESTEKVGEQGEAEEKASETKEEEKPTFEQQYKTLQGMFDAEKKKWDEEKESFRQEIEQAKSKSNEPSKPEPGAEVKEIDLNDISDLLTDEEKEILKEHDDDYDSISKAESIRRNATAKKLLQVVDSRFAIVGEALKSIIAEVQKGSDEKHFSAIEAAHKDYKTLRSDIKAWIGIQPKYLQAGLNEAYSAGSSEEVIDLITRFKKETGRIKPQATDTKETDAETERRKKSLSSVSDTRSPINAEGEKPAASDFVNAFKEAAMKKAAGIG